MTNLIFSIFTVLVTNVSEVASPIPEYSYILPSYPPQYFTPPKTKSVYKSCYRVTNRVDTLTGPPVTIELGRVIVWSTAEDFTQVTEWKSSGVRTNEIQTVSLTGTNGYSYGIQWNSNAIFRSESLIVTNLLHVSTNGHTR